MRFRKLSSYDSKLFSYDSELLSYDSKLLSYDSKLLSYDSKLLSHHSEPNLPCHSEPLGEESQNEESPINPLEIFRDESFCNQLLALAKKSRIYIDEISQDCVLHTGFDTQNAQNLIDRFLYFIFRNKDEIEALSIIYARDYKNRHLTYKRIREACDQAKARFYGHSKPLECVCIAR